MNKEEIIRVAVFEDDHEQRDGLTAILSLAPGILCVGDFPDARDVVANVSSCKPHVVLMDITMPGVNGIMAAARLRQHYPGLLIIMRTVLDDDERIFSAVKAGADGYFLKQTPPDRLIDGIRLAVEGGVPMTPSIARRVLRMVDGHPAASNEFHLSQREREVLSLLVKGFTYKRIAEELGVTYATVNKHVSNMYVKLHVHCINEAVALALRKGLV
jgi:DNA-binding NarL/FixJ family response regulator